MQGDRKVNYPELHMAMLGHELRNVLGGVVGLTELLGGSGLNNEQQALTRALQQSGRQMRWLIESIGLDGKTAEFPFSPRLRPFNGVEMLEQAIRCHIPAALQNDHLLLLAVEPTLPAWWHCDMRLIRLLLDNLLGNAIKYTRSGEVVLEVRRPCGADRDSEGLELTVRDSGPGITGAASKRIFEPWEQLGDHQENTGGAGLGLHVCQRIVSAMNGTIDYVCSGGAGSTFRVCLPKAIDPRLADQIRRPSILITSLDCRVSVRVGLHASLKTVLSRLGVLRFGNHENELADDCRATHRIGITEQAVPSSMGKPQTGLLFTHLPGKRATSRVLTSRWLAPPFLESTLGPVLMEMALERRLAAVADAQLNPADETPDSVPTQP